MEARYLFQFGMADRGAIKDSFSGNTLPLMHLQLPSPLSLSLSPCSALIFSKISQSLCVSSFYWHRVWFAASVSLCSVCLPFHSVSPSLSCSPLQKNLARNRDRRAPAVFFWHTLPFLNQNQLRWNQVITLAASVLSHILLFLLKVYEILHFEKQRAARQSVRRTGARWISKGDCFINKAEKKGITC